MNPFKMDVMVTLCEDGITFSGLIDGEYRNIGLDQAMEPNGRTLEVVAEAFARTQYREWGNSLHKEANGKQTPTPALMSEDDGWRGYGEVIRFETRWWLIAIQEKLNDELRFAAGVKV